MLNALCLSWLVALTVKPAPLMKLDGKAIAVSSDGKTLWVSNGRKVTAVDALNGKKRYDVEKKLGAGPGPLLGVDQTRVVVQAMKEKKYRFSMVDAGVPSVVPFRLPKDSTLPELTVAFSTEAQTMVGLMTLGDSLTDLLAWDFAQDPPQESPRTGISTSCYSLWAYQKNAHLICTDGLHTFDLTSPGNAIQTTATDEGVQVPKGAVISGSGNRVVYAHNGQLVVVDFSNPKQKTTRTLALPEGVTVDDVALLASQPVAVATMADHGEIWLWEYTEDARITRVKVAAPTVLAVASSVQSRLWVRTKPGVLRLDLLF